MKKSRIVIAVCVFFLLTGLLLAAAQALLVPHDPLANPEAALIGEFVDAFAEEDVIFLGDCEIYESISTVTLWNEYGINAYACGSPQQLLWHSYAMLQHAFSVGQPSVVVLGAYALRYDEPQNEAYNRMALDALPLSRAKLSAVPASMTQGESLLSYLFPLLRYHDRWDTLTWRDVTLLAEPPTAVSYHGYLMQTGVLPDENGRPDHEGALPLTEPAFGERAVDYLEKIAQLCRENGAQLILLKAPTDSWAYPWYEEWEAQTEALAARMEISYYNLLEAIDEIGLDYSADTYDGGMHLNVYGAEKTARYLGEILQRYGVPDRRDNERLFDEWKGWTERYEHEKEPVD